MTTWRDAEKGSNVYLVQEDKTMHVMSVHAPNSYCDVWTAQAEYLNEDFRQIKFSGLFNGGATREEAKVVAEAALKILGES